MSEFPILAGPAPLTSMLRCLLPQPAVPVSLPGLELAYSSRTAPHQLVSGDWYDVILLPRGRTALLTGDAMGYGPGAAAVMAQLRAASHVLAELDLAPEALLWRLNRLTVALGLPAFATLLCTVIDPGTRTAMIGCAGHLPPVLVTATGETELIRVAPGLPLGLGGDGGTTTVVALPPRCTLALYTDGLVENRTRTFETGIGELRQRLSSASGPLQAVCDTVAGQLSQQADDDTTLVLAHIP